MPTTQHRSRPFASEREALAAFADALRAALRLEPLERHDGARETAAARARAARPADVAVYGVERSSRGMSWGAS